MDPGALHRSSETGDVVAASAGARHRVRRGTALAVEVRVGTRSVFPVFVDDARHVLGRLRRRGVEAMRWPGAEQIPLDPAQFPGAHTWLAGSLCLPLGTSLVGPRVDRLARVVRETAITAPTNGIATSAG